ncbi:DUF3857 domain-containing protein [Marnyiella aurantia]|uniref:DUF3857 domain-containing protein n=1 Tax=Marnyiella aurantia TaxID=2758037 RepID=A0A7D7QV90_9FLAO|nr:DUF3857 domain-containing protein [Marnyiella aurantia]MBA5246741.1 DUF3857 domain-containing protein [Marnyiella aurantia]QMS97910.1 DUF3857 domain-containing protein [Marnyiella aurantia]
MKKNLFVLTLFMFVFANAQNKFRETPKLTTEDLKSERSSKFTDAPAEVLFKSSHFLIDYNGHMYQKVSRRVKVYNKDNAAEYLSHEIALYDNKRDPPETLSELKAFTYNYENGDIVPTKIPRDERYKSKEDKNYTVTKFTFPNVKNGSVVEYSYIIKTPFLGSTPKILIEEAIPVRYSEFVLDTPTILAYTINYSGTLSPSQRIVEEKPMFGKPYQTYRFAFENIAPFQNEKYVLNNTNYRTGLMAELNSSMIDNKFTSYAISWSDIRKRLYEHSNFGLELKKLNSVKDVLPSEIKTIPVALERADAILKFVQKDFTWNGERSVFTDRGIKNLLSAKVGNSAEINLLLTQLLQDAGLKAEPVVLATVDQGTLLSYAPSISKLNYVIAAVYVNGKNHLLDATQKQSEIDMISPDALNYSGFIMTPKEAVEINMRYPYRSKTILSVDAIMNPDGTFGGNFKDRDTKLYAMMVNSRYNSDKAGFASSYKDTYKFPITNLKQGVQGNNDFETSFDFTSDSFVDAIGSKLVFNPLLFLYSQNHNFDQKEPRKAPLEFYSAYDRTKKVTITIPDNFEFQNVPKSKKFRTDDNALQYSYVVTQNGNKLTVETTVSIDDSVYPKEYYPAFVQIFNNITKQEAQVVTVVKK